jgi:hypothetical protein
MKKNYKIAIGVGVLALLFIAYKKGVFGGSEGGNGGSEGGNGGSEGGDGGSEEEILKSSMPTSTPIINLTAASETPQVVNIPPQFGGETAIVNKLPAGAFQTFN